MTSPTALYDLIRFSTATTGTGTLTVGSAVPPFMTPATYGSPFNSGTTVVWYSIIDVAGGNSETGTGTYTASGATLTRTVITSTNSNSAISLSGSAQVCFTAIANAIVPSTQAATSSVLGLVKPDGTTITNSSGAISVTYGTAANTAAQGNDSRFPTYNSWTPTDDSGASLSFTNVDCEYVISGNFVFIVGTLTYPSTANASGAKISGLPVTVANRGAGNTGGFATAGTLGGPAAMFAQTAADTNYFTFALQAGGGVTNANLSTLTVKFNFFYPLS